MDYNDRVATSFRYPKLDLGENVTFMTALGRSPEEESFAFMQSDLARSELEPDDLFAKPSTVSGSTSYLIPYFYPDQSPIVTADGFIRMYRQRMDNRKQRYLQPSIEDIGDVAVVPYINPRLYACKNREYLAICEGEKKTAAVIKYLDMPAIGIGGKDNWRYEKKMRVHPWVYEVAQNLGVSKIIIIPDGDVNQFHIKKSYSTFAKILEDHYEVVLLNPSDKIDDLIVQWLKRGLSLDDEFAEIEELEDKVEDIKFLVERYNLSYTQTKTSIRLDINESNVRTLLTRHKSFPTIWHNEDTNFVHMDDMELREGREDMDILCTLQYNLGMPNLTLGKAHNAVSNVALENSRSPIKDWLDGLEWDGEDRLENLFTNYCGTPNSELAREAGHKWLVGAVARKMDPGCILDYMVITTGPQGIGKSSLPIILFGIDNVINLLGTESQTKDEVAKFHMGWCVNYEELSGMKRADKEHLKAMITNRMDSTRLPYARTTSNLKRQCVLYGSTNKRQFLNNDESGHRRFGVVKVAQVQFSDLERDRGQLWAEAVVRYRRGESYSNLDYADEHARQFVSYPHHVMLWREYWEDNAPEFKERRKIDDMVYFTREDIAAISGLEYSGGRSSFQLRDVIEHAQEHDGLRYAQSWKKGPDGKQLRRVYLIRG